jgi:transposase
MAEPHSAEFRKRVVESYESGEGGYNSIAERFKIGRSSVQRWVAQFRQMGHLEPQKKGGGRHSDISLKELEGVVAKLGDATAGEITAEYNRGRRGRKRRHVSSIKRALHRAGFVVKKSG